jgi:Icc protein
MQNQIFQNPLRIVVISDLHLNGDSSMSPRGVEVRSAFRDVLKFSEQFAPEVYIYLGDISHSGEVSRQEAQSAYKFMQESITHLKVPSFFVAGNHDDASMMREQLQKCDARYCSEERMTYSTKLQNITFLIIDANDPTLTGAQGRVNDEDLSFIDEVLEEAEGPCIVALHYPPFDLDSPWLRERMLLTNGDEFHSLIARYRDKILFVLYGHVHRTGVQVIDGISYVAVGSTSFKFQNGPFDDSVKISHGDSYFNLISCYPRGFTSKVYNVPTEFKE